MGRYPCGVSMTHAADPGPPMGQWRQGALAGTVYLNAGQVRVFVDSDGCRLDLTWQQWGNLVAGVGERFVALALADPYVIQAARNSIAWAAAARDSADPPPGQGD